MAVLRTQYQGSPWPSLDWSALVMPLVAMAGGILAGVVAANGNAKVAALLVAAVAGWFVIRSPMLVLWSVTVLGLVVSGAIRLYAPEFQQVRWLLAPLSLLLALHAVITIMTARDSGGRWPAMLWWASAFVVVLVVSSLLNGVGGVNMIVALKGYFQVWCVLFALPFLTEQKMFIERLPRVFFWIALAQLPFVLHQFLVLVPARHGLGDGVVPVDVIAGTFGADLDGGGANAALATFMLIVLAGLLGYWREGLLSTSRLILAGTILLIPELLNEAKVTAVYLLIVFIVVFWEDIKTRPLRCIAVLTGVTGLLIIALTAYTIAAPGSKVHNVGDLIEATYDYNMSTDPTSFDGRLSRWGALVYWEKYGATSLFDILLGHGAGTSRLATTAGSSAGSVDQVELGVDKIAVSAVLWEAGVLGLACLFLMHWYAACAAGRLARRYRNTPSRAVIFQAAQAAVIILLINLWHKNLFVFSAPYQTLVVIILGAIAYADRAAQSDWTHRAAKATGPGHRLLTKRFGFSPLSDRS